ncbi:MAG: acetolactate synthase small subunit [Spirochaetes bacterium]|nr:acetolactate synthase small subunit [Spirochaetota bacterium]
MRHVISVQVENKSGVLARVAGLFSARGYNIDSLTVGTTERQDVSVMTIVVKGDDKIIEQVKKQLNKLIDVIKISDHLISNSIQRELAILKVSVSPSKRLEVFQLAQMFKAEIADMSQKNMTLSIDSDPESLDKFIELLRPYGIKELIRSGRVSLLRG